MRSDRSTEWRPPWVPRTPGQWALAALGLGTLVAGATSLLVIVAVAAFALAPLAVWLAWNVLGFASAIGAPELGFGGILLLALFLVCGTFGRLAIAVGVALFDPAWYHGSATLHWPQASLRTFLALAVLLVVAAIPGRRRAAAERKATSQND